MNTFSNERLHLSVVTNNLSSFTVVNDAATSNTDYKLEVVHKDAALGGTYYTKNLPNTLTKPPTGATINFMDGTDPGVKSWTFNNVEVSGADVTGFDLATKITGTVNVFGTSDIIVNDFLNLTNLFESVSAYTDGELQVNYSTTTVGGGSASFIVDLV